jgi:hypothetical protein
LKASNSKLISFKNKIIDRDIVESKPTFESYYNTKCKFMTTTPSIRSMNNSPSNKQHDNSAHYEEGFTYKKDNLTKMLK